MKQEKTTKINNGVSIILIALLAVILITVSIIGTMTKCFTDSGSFEQNLEQEPTGNATDENGNDMINGENYPMPTKMMFKSASDISTTSSSGITLTATVKPLTAANKEVDWTTAWSNPTSAWANGKTVSSYLTVTPTSDGSLSANVSCLEAFGEPIKVIVTSRVNEGATATCTVDYAKRLATNAKLAFNTSLFAPTSELNSAAVSKVNCLKAANWQGYAPVYQAETFEYVPEYTVGTVVDTNFSYKIFIAPNTAFHTSLTSNGLTSTTTWKEIEPKAWNIFETLSPNVFPRNGMSGAYENLNKFLTAVTNCSAEYDFEIKVSATTSFESKDYLFKCSFDRNGAGFAVESITLGNETLVV